jgi:pimeloyl-ACP methyl ester carboxylesterase
MKIKKGLKNSSQISSKNIEVNSKKIHYLEKGHGEVIALLHGWPASAEMFVPLMKTLPSNKRVVAIDLPGFGRSDELDVYHNYDNIVQQLDLFFRELSIDRCTLFGMSLGAALAIRYAKRYPNKIKKVIANSPPIHFIDQISLAQKVLLKVSDYFPFVKIGIFKLMQGRSASLHNLFWGEKGPDTKFVTEKMISEALKFKLKALDETVHAFAYTDLKEDLKDIKVNVVVICGKDDTLFLNEARKLKKVSRNVDIVAVKGDHLLSIKKPQVLAKLLL